MRTLEDLDVAGKRVLVRVDFNVPLGEHGEITDDARIRGALPTLSELREQGARLLLAAHLGRPKGRDAKLSLRPVAERLAELLGEPVEFAPSLDEVPDGDVVMLENVRFEPGETENDEQLGRRYAALADAYVNDAFGAAHRAHASTEAVAHLLPSAAGRLLEREVETLTGILREPRRPLVAVVGGAKVTDKIGVLDAFLRRADRLLIGGAMCFPFFKAMGHRVGASLCEEEGLEPARRVLAAGDEKLRLPSDLVAGREFSAETETKELDGSRRARRLDGARHRAPQRRRLRRGRARRGQRVLERPDGRLRAGAVRRGHAHRRRGRRRVRCGHGGRRRRFRGGAGPVRAGRPRDARLHRRRRRAGADRGQAPPGRGGPQRMSRTPFIAGNWKMHKTIAEAERYIQAFLPRVAAVDGVEIVLCPPFPALAPLVDSARGSQVAIYAQTMHEAGEGAFTGEISAPMLAEIDVHGVILGHSERRAYFNETDRALQLKVPKALEAGLTPILCVGETEEERERGDTERKLRHQVQEGLEQVAPDRLPEVVVAYEPVWAIGTGRVATPEQAQEAIAFVRALVAGFDEQAAEHVRILYGGSCKPDNAAELMALPDVDGALVGGASLDPADFGAIVEIAAREA